MKVWYLDHSAVAVKTEKHLLLIDLAGRALSGQPGEGLAEGCVSPDEIKDEDVLVFVSHEHKDHFDPAIFSLREKLSRVRFVLPEELDEVYQADLFVSAEEEQCKHYALPDCHITTFASTDIGVAYLLEIDGLRIYHAGDLNWWHWEGEDEFNRDQERRYQHQMQLLAQELDGEPLDLACVPVDPRLEGDFLRGLLAFDAAVRAEHILPIHLWGDLSVPDRIREQVRPQLWERVLPLKERGRVL